MTKLPKARTENLLEQNLINETLVYDLVINKAFNLNESSTIVYKACGQGVTLDELKRRHQFTDDFIYLALDELKKHNLLIGEYESPFDGTSRREAIKKVGLATMLALPLISGLVAPSAAQAASATSIPGLLEVCNRNKPPACSGSDCVDIVMDASHCCSPANSARSFVLLPGQDFTSPAGQTVLGGTLAPLDETEYCRTQVGCCNGATATGTCTFTPQNPEPNPFLDSYDADCLCSCPA